MKKILISHRGGKPYRLNGGEYMKSSFEIMPLEEAKDTELSFKGRFASVIITKGEEIISTNVGDCKIKEGETYMLPVSIMSINVLLVKRVKYSYFLSFC